MKLFLFMLLLFTSVQATTITLKSGWNLVGATVDGINIDTTIPTASTVWKYDSVHEVWLVASPDGSQSAAITASPYTTFSSVDKGEGFWVHVLSDTSITLGVQATDLQRTLASFVAGSASGLANAAEVASDSALGTLTATSGTSTLARALYSTVPPAFVSNDTNMQMTIEDIVAATNVTATVLFKVDGQPQNPNHIMDVSGASYGLATMETTMQNLGLFFIGLSSAGSNAGDYIATNIESHIQAVSTIKNSPLFFIVGDTALQNFISGFPTDMSSVSSITPTQWGTMASEFQTLTGGAGGPNLDVSIDFSRINLFTSIVFDSTLNIGGVEVNLPGLNTNHAPTSLSEYQSTDLLNLNFLGSGEGNAYINGTTAILSNVELNVTMDPENGNATSVNGSYDISVTINNETYTGTPTFDRSGCKGADIYDGSNNFVARMKIFEDGLWIVDENNVQIEKVLIP